jgi:HEAT repeat protein
VLVLPLSLLISGTLAALRQIFHLSACPNLASHLSGAASTLGGFGPSAPEAGPPLIEALKDPDQHVRSVSASALGTLGLAATEAVLALILSALIAVLHHDAEPLVRRSAADALVKSPAAAEAVPILAAALGDANWCVRRGAASALGVAGPAATEAVPALTEALKDPEEVVRAAAADVSGEDRAGRSNRRFQYLRKRYSPHAGLKVHPFGYPR